MSSILSEEEKRELERIIKSTRERKEEDPIIYWQGSDMVWVYAGYSGNDQYYLLSDSLCRKVRPVVKQVLSNVDYFYFADFLRHFCPELAKKYY